MTLYAVMYVFFLYICFEKHLSDYCLNGWKGLEWQSKVTILFGCFYFQVNCKLISGKMPWLLTVTLGATVGTPRWVITSPLRISWRLSSPRSAVGAICWWMLVPPVMAESCQSWKRGWNRWGSGLLWTEMLYTEHDRGPTKTTPSLKMCGKLWCDWLYIKLWCDDCTYILLHDPLENKTFDMEK